MNIIIVGGGKVGTNLTDILSNEGHNVTIIDILPKLVEDIVNNNDIIGYCGNGASYPIQLEAGVSECDIFIAVTGSDELNIMSCLVAEKLGAKHSVARVRNPEYSLQMDFMRDKLGIDLVINPDFETANEISRIIEFPAAERVETFAKGRIELAEITVSKHSVLDGLLLSDLRQTLKVDMLICAVQRGEEVIIPKGSFRIEAGDIVHFSAAKLKIASVFKAFGMEKRKIKSVIVIGGSPSAYYLSKYLAKSGRKVRLIEVNKNKAAELEEKLNDVSVICGDGADTEILEEYGIRDADAVITLTNKDEENLIISMYAASRKTGKIVCKVTRPALLDMVSHTVENCSTVYPQEITANIILRYVRAVNNVNGSQVETLYRILDGKVEAAEFVAAANCKLNGVELKDIKLKPDVLIACVSHKNTVIIPNGSTVISEGDSVIVITAGKKITDLNDIIA